METKIENTSKQTTQLWDPPILSHAWWKMKIENPNSLNALIKERMGDFLASRGRQEMDPWVLCSHLQGYLIIYK